VPTITASNRMQASAQEPGDGSDRTIVIIDGQTFILDRPAATWLLDDLTSVHVSDCGACGGTGLEGRARIFPCDECNGLGWVR